MDPDPLRQFAQWFAEAREAGGFMAEAATLATASPDGRPSARIVLVKRFDESGFAFFSGYRSRKGRELAVNPHAALLFHWAKLGRQVRVEGLVARVTPEETAAYVRSRPRESQLSALASRQSEVIPSRHALEDAVGELTRRHAGEDLPLPADWGGYRLKPEEYELWQHRADRLHDRVRYRRSRERDGWVRERLAP